MNESDNREMLERIFLGEDVIAFSAEEEYEARAENFVMEMPQSGERIVGRDAMRAMQEAYPAPPSARLRRIVGSGDLFVAELTSDYGGEVYHVAVVVEFDAEGRIARETRYYARPFDPPRWRAEWVQSMG